mgnify:CR=1 FL=1
MSERDERPWTEAEWMKVMQRMGMVIVAGTTRPSSPRERRARAARLLGMMVRMIGRCPARVEAAYRAAAAVDLMPEHLRDQIDGLVRLERREDKPRTPV